MNLKTVKVIPPKISYIKKKKKVCAYVRVSDGKDAMLNSMSAQISYYQNYIQCNPEWDLVDIYVDKAITGTKRNREQFLRMLNDCRQRKIDIIITKSISRFARNTVTMLETVRELKLLDIDVYFEKENIHSLSGEGELMLTILSSYAQEESYSVSENCKWHIRNKFQKGEPVNWRFMYGYEIKDGEITVNNKQARIVRSIFRDYINGKPVTEIVQDLTDKKVSSLMGGSWRAQRIYQILANEKYTGNCLLQKRFIENHITKKEIKNKGELPRYYSENTHPAIIDIDTYENAKKLLETNKDNNKAKSPKKKYPFSGIIKCAYCGKNYKRKITKTEIAWNCSTYIAKGKACCYTKQIPEDILYQMTSEVLGLRSFNETIFKNSVKQIIIPEFNHITYIFKDDRTITKIWEDKSRSDSWTPVMRKRASERYVKNKNKEF